MIDLLSIANIISTLLFFFRDMLVRRKRKEGKEGRKEVGREEDKGSHFSNCHSTCTPSLSGAWMVKERIQVGVMDSVIENWHLNCPLWCVAQIPPQDQGTYFSAARGTGHWSLIFDLLSRKFLYKTELLHPKTYLIFGDNMPYWYNIPWLFPWSYISLCSLSFSCSLFKHTHTSTIC